MLSYLQSLCAILLGVAMVSGAMFGLNRTLEESTRKRANTVNGWQLSILGGIYAVALGFMLSDAWLAYQTAAADVRQEAAAALSISRASGSLPRACASVLHDDVQRYLQVVDTVEWPAMEAHTSGEQAAPILQNMWNTVNRCGEHGPAPDESVLTALETLQTQRNARIEDYEGHLPAMMWCVLLFGAVAVVGSSCLLGNERKSFHAFHVISLTVLILLMLLAIFDLDRPYEGATRVSSQPFRAVLAQMPR